MQKDLSEAIYPHVSTFNMTKAELQSWPVSRTCCQSWPERWLYSNWFHWSMSHRQQLWLYCYSNRLLGLRHGDRVMLSIKHHWQEYMEAKSGHVAKFMPCFDGPFLITWVHPERLSYTLYLPNKPNCFPTFHAMLLWPYTPNHDKLFPSHMLTQPGPVVTTHSNEEWQINSILDEWTCGCGKQYLVHWWGWGLEEDCWLPGCEVAETEVLDKWLVS